MLPSEHGVMTDSWVSLPKMAGAHPVRRLQMTGYHLIMLGLQVPSVVTAHVCGIAMKRLDRDVSQANAYPGRRL